MNLLHVEKGHCNKQLYIISEENLPILIMNPTNFR